jgi:LPS-assembly lipoprotein
MSKFATLFALITTMVTLVACGFHPVYGVNKHTNIGVEQHLAQIHIGNIKDREGQHLRNELIDRFYRDERPNSPLYTLSIQNLRERITELDITKDAESTRGQLRTTARLVLTDQDGAILLERNVSSTASFNVLASEFTNRVSEQNTRENTLGDLARQIEQHIALYFKKAQ